MITATPELASLRNAKNLVDMLKAARPNDVAPKLVLNQVGVPKRPEIPAAEFGKALGTEISAIIPYDAQTFGTAQSNGQMVFEVAPKSKAAEALAGVSGVTEARFAALSPACQVRSVRTHAGRPELRRSHARVVSQ